MWYTNRASAMHIYFVLIPHHMEEKETTKTARVRDHDKKVFYEERFRCESNTAVSRVDMDGRVLSEFGEYRPLSLREVQGLSHHVSQLLIEVERKKRNSSWRGALAHYNDGTAPLEDNTSYWQVNPSPIVGSESESSTVDTHVVDMTPASGIERLATFLRFGTEEKADFNGTSEFCNTIRGTNSSGWKGFFSQKYNSLKNSLSGEDHSEYNVDDDRSRAVVEMSLYRAAFGSGDAGGTELSPSRFVRDTSVLPMDSQRGVPANPGACASQAFLDQGHTAEALTYGIYVTEYQAKEIPVTNEAKDLGRKLLKKKIGLEITDEQLAQFPTQTRAPMMHRGLMFCVAVEKSGTGSFQDGCEHRDDAGRCYACTEISYDSRAATQQGLIVETEIGGSRGIFDSVKRIIKVAEGVSCRQLNDVWTSLPHATGQPVHDFAGAHHWHHTHHNANTFVKVFADKLSGVLITSREDNFSHGVNIFPSLKNCVKGVQTVTLADAGGLAGLEALTERGGERVRDAELSATSVAEQLQSCQSAVSEASEHERLHCIENALMNITRDSDSHDIQGAGEMASLLQLKVDDPGWDGTWDDSETW